MHEDVGVGEETKREIETKFPTAIIFLFLSFLSVHYFSQVFPDMS